MKKFILFFAAIALFGISKPVMAGWHFGEFQTMDVSIEYFDYAFLTPSGQPVYYIGTNMRYRITLKNNGNRTYKNFQSKTVLRWKDSVTCLRWWYDNQTVSYKKDNPLPGNSDSGLRTADMGKKGSTSYEASYYIPWGICPGEAYVLVEGRHKNKSGREEVASFTIPLGVRIARK